MNHFKKSYKAIVKYFLQKLQGFSSIIGVFLSLKRRDDPIWCGTPCSILKINYLWVALSSFRLKFLGFNTILLQKYSNAFNVSHPNYRQTRNLTMLKRMSEVSVLMFLILKTIFTLDCSCVYLTIYFSAYFTHHSSDLKILLIRPKNIAHPT